MSDEAVPEIDPLGAVRALEAGAYLLDVREDEEWTAGHASAAHHVPLGALGDHLDELPKDREILVVCRSGGRSHLAATALRSAGYAASNLTGGMLAWAATDLEIVAESGPGTVI